MKEEQGLITGRALKCAMRTIITLQDSDDKELVYEALMTLANAQFLNERYSAARQSFERAAAIADSANETDKAAVAMITIIEELGTRLKSEDLERVYEQAHIYATIQRTPSVIERLRASQKLVIPAVDRRTVSSQGNSSQMVRLPGDEVNWEGFSLKVETARFEQLWIERAMRDAGGNRTAAARLLGFKHRQSFTYSLNKKHIAAKKSS